MSLVSSVWGGAALSFNLEEDETGEVNETSKLSLRFTEVICSLTGDVMLERIAAPLNMKANGDDGFRGELRLLLIAEVEGTDWDFSVKAWCRIDMEGLDGEQRSIIGGNDISSSAIASSITGFLTLSDNLEFNSEGNTESLGWDFILRGAVGLRI